MLLKLFSVAISATLGGNCSVNLTEKQMHLQKKLIFDWLSTGKKSFSEKLSLIWRISRNKTSKQKRASFQQEPICLKLNAAPATKTKYFFEEKFPKKFKFRKNSQLKRKPSQLRIITQKQNKVITPKQTNLWTERYGIAHCLEVLELRNLQPSSQSFQLSTLFRRKKLSWPEP